MRVFQIMNDEVLIINGDKQYKDTPANFTADSGIDISRISMTIYDDHQKCCVVNKQWLEYPNNELEKRIDAVEKYIDAQAKRTYVAPPEPTAEEKAAEKINSIISDKDSQLRDIKDAAIIVILTNDTELQEELKTEYTTLMSDTNARLEEVKANG